MSHLAASVITGFSHSFREFASRVRDLSENLSDEQFWANPYDYGNSFGHLTLHLTGNLNYYIGAQIAGTGYVRDREREFTEGQRPAKEEVLRRLEGGVAMVVSALEQETAETLMQPYVAAGAAPWVTDRFSIYLRCVTHFHHHLGQMIYLAKEAAG
jgi:Protein of unknown function (DUF1572)